MSQRQNHKENILKWMKAKYIKTKLKGNFLSTDAYILKEGRSQVSLVSNFPHYWTRKSKNLKEKKKKTVERNKIEKNLWNQKLVLWEYQQNLKICN